jgi:hypothetical protein
MPSQRSQRWKSSQLLLEINRKMIIMCLDIIILNPVKGLIENETYRIRSRSRRIKMKRGDRRGYLGRDPAPLGAIHRSFVSFVSLRSDSSPSGRVRRSIVIPLKKYIELKIKPKRKKKSHT